MSFSKEENENNQEKIRSNFITNAAEFGFSNIELENSNRLRIDAVMAISEFQDICNVNKWDFNYSVLYISLLEEGALQVPLVFNANNKGYSVFFIYSHEDAKKFNDAMQKVKETAYPNAIYFSSFDLSEVKEKVTSTRTLHLSDLRFEKDIDLIGEYAMWWSDEDEPTFGNSQTKDILANIYEIHKDYESVYAGYLLNQIGLTDELGRALLPQQEKALIVVAPENKSILLILSQEKGIRFLFPTETTSRFYREQFLAAIRIDFLTLRLSLQEQQIPKDEPSELNGLDWFKFMVKRTEENEKKGQLIKSIGGWGADYDQSYGLN